MKYEGITWGPSMRGYCADNNNRIARVSGSLAALKNKDGQFAREHRMLLNLYLEIDAVLARHIHLADDCAVRPTTSAVSEETGR